MAKKAKLDLSGAGLKRLVINHCEKAVFAACAAALFLLAYWGYQKPVFDDSQSNPGKLLRMSETSNARIKATAWVNANQEDLSFAKFRISDDTVLDQVKKLNAILLDPAAYPTFPPGEISLSTKPKRAKPEILAATDIRAQFAYQLIALKPGIGGGSNRINDGAWAIQQEQKKKEEKKPPQDNNSGRSGRQGMEEDDGTEEGDDRSDEENMESGAGNQPGSGPGKSNAPNNAKEVPGSMLAELEGVPVERKIPSGFDDDDNEIAPSIMWRQCVCVTALVPYKEQLKRYETALKGTRRYDPTVDFPKYIGLVISRRIDGGEWKEITQEIQAFSKRATSLSYPSLVSEDQFDPFLNASIPTFLNSNFDNFVMHPKSGLRDFLSDGNPVEADSKSSKKSSEETRSDSGNFEDFDASGENDPEEDSSVEMKPVFNYPTSENAPEFKQLRFFDLLANSAIKPGVKVEYKVAVILSNPNLPLSFVIDEKSLQNSSSNSGSSASDRAGDLAAGGGSGAGSMMPGSGSGASGGGSGASGGGYMGGGGGSGKRGGGYVPATAELELEMLGNPFITDGDLDGTIRRDILKFKDLGPASINDKGLAQKYGMVSAESPACLPVTFTVPGNQHVSGPAAPLTIRKAGNIEFFDVEPKGKLVVLVQDQALQIKVPGRKDVFAGTPMVFDAAAEVFNPLDWSIRWIGPRVRNKQGQFDPEKRGNYKFDTGAMVLNVVPSQKLDNPSGEKQTFMSPAEILVFDGQGGFTLRNELDDLTAFRQATFAADSAQAGSSPSASGKSGQPGDAPDFGKGFSGFNKDDKEKAKQDRFNNLKGSGGGDRNKGN